MRKEDIEDMIFNAMLSRSELISKFFDTRRNINRECGFPESNSEITVQKLQDLYDRESIATRVVDVFPLECWNVSPCIYEDEDEEIETEFERKLKEINKQLHVEDNYYEDKKEDLSSLYEYFLRIDKLSGIGHYGILLLGVNDSNNVDLSLPVDISKENELLYIRCLPESFAQISERDTDITSPRFDYPVRYSITLNSLDNFSSESGINISTNTVEVHWTRVIHIADNLTSSELLGVPRLRPVLNNVLNLQKLLAGSAEMYWKGAFPGLALESNPQLGGDVKLDEERTKDMMEQYMEGLKRYFALVGMTVKSIAPQVVDPSKQIDVQLDAICIQLGIPKRIFLGSERGELSSSQDSDSWKERLNNRRKNYITPKIICPFINRLINLNILPTPKSYCVEWPDRENLTKKDKAVIGQANTQSLSTYVSAGLDVIMSPLDFLIRIIGMSNEEAQIVLDNTHNLSMFDIEKIKEESRVSYAGMTEDELKQMDEEVMKEMDDDI